MIQKRGRKAVVFVIFMAMMLTILPMKLRVNAGLVNNSQSIPYLTYSVGEKKYSPATLNGGTYTLVTSNMNTDWNNGWYVVSGNITMTKNINVKGRVNLLLMDDSSLTLSGYYIDVPSNTSLTIYSQSKGTGNLTVNAGTNGHAGIGSGSFQTLGEITIYGGTIHATGGEYRPNDPEAEWDEYTRGAGIGGVDTTIEYGAFNGAWTGTGKVNIYGGNVSAFGNNTRGIIAENVHIITVGTFRINSTRIYRGSDNWQSESQGIIKCANWSWNVYNSPSLKNNFTLPEGETLANPSGSTLTVDEGATLDVSKGNLDNKGTIIVKGKLIVKPGYEYPETIHVIDSGVVEGITLSKEYIVQWDTNGDQTIDTTTFVKEGDTPEAPTPSKEGTESILYKFTNWNPSIAPASNHATYSAQFTPVNVYTVSYENGEGYQIAIQNPQDKYEDGSTVTFKLNITDGYYGKNLSVMANGENLTPAEDAYSFVIHDNTTLSVSGVVRDATKPNVEIKLNDQANDVKFNASNKANISNVNVKLTVTDGETKVVKKGIYLSLTAEENLSSLMYFYVVGDSFTLREIADLFPEVNKKIKGNEDFEIHIYGYAQDQAGNISYTTGPVIRVDQTLPTITGVENGGEYHTSVKVHAEDANSVTLYNGEQPIDNDVILTPRGGYEQITIKAVDSFKNEYSVSFKLIPLLKPYYNVSLITEKNVTKENVDDIHDALAKISFDFLNENLQPEEIMILSDFNERLTNANKAVEDVNKFEKEVSAVPTFEPADSSAHEKYQSLKSKYDAFSDHQKSLIDANALSKYQNLQTLLTPKITEGNGSKFYTHITPSLVLESDGHLESFVKLMIDGEQVNEVNYQKEKGGTIITLPQTYLNSLSIASHTFTFVYQNDYAASGTFEVIEGDLVAPVISGVDANGVYHTSVKIHAEDRNEVTLYKNGEKIENDAILTPGDTEEQITIKAVDTFNNESSITFTLSPLNDVYKEESDINKDNFKLDDLTKIKESIKKIKDDLNNENIQENEKEKLNALKEQLKQVEEAIEAVKTFEQSVKDIPEFEPADASVHNKYVSLKVQYDSFNENQITLISQEVKEKFENIAKNLEPIILEGDGGYYLKGSNKPLVLKSNGHFDSFTGLLIDGELVNESNYDKVAGSTVITLKNEYLKTLKGGDHPFVFRYQNGYEAFGTFRVLYPATPTPEVKGVVMYRVYNPNSGEHFYTANEEERNGLIYLGWNDEGTGWIAVETSDVPVYRLYNANGGEHHYTTSLEEKDMLVAAGWKDEDIAFYSASDKDIPVYRVYNPNAFANNHHYTTSKEERDSLIALGWKDEGICWYGIQG